MLAKQHTAALFEKPMFATQPVVGLISGFEPRRGAAWISEFARANPHLAIFVYDALLEHPYRNPPENVVIFSADAEETLSVLPIFFQALDLVCFPRGAGNTALHRFRGNGLWCPVRCHDEIWDTCGSFGGRRCREVRLG